MSAHDYGFADKLLHQLALGIPALAELSFDLDQKASRVAMAAPDVARLPHVFVAGLARAGTTVILRHLHETGQFRSLTYRDMPFALAPNLWKRFSTRWHQRQALQARAHGDGLMVNADSPEALEEIFWRVQCGGDYIGRTGLSAHHPDEQDQSLFQRYVAAILASGERGQWRYLSKNNNNILRLPALRDAFPQSVFIIPFRSPVTQAWSLWRQHEHFSRMQKSRRFVRSYMDWLVHHEFGLGHRPFLIGGALPSALAPDMPDYWLEMWIRTYATLCEQRHDRTIFLCYEDLCTRPEVWPRMLDRLDLRQGAEPGFILKADANAEPGRFTSSRLNAAEEIYQRLRTMS